MNRLVYVASPIDNHTMSPQLLGAIDRIATDLTDAGAVVYRPDHAFRVPNTEVHAPTGHIREINNRALDVSGSLLVVLPLDARTWGVPAEIERAILTGKNVALVTVGNRPLSWSQMYTEVTYYKNDDVAALLQKLPSTAHCIAEQFGFITTDLEEVQNVAASH